jgi:hypothetical protein
MKKILILIAVSLGMMSFTEYQADTEGIVKALKSGSATEVSAYFDEFLDLKLLDKAEVKNMGRNQATITLKAFFDENNVKGFEKASDREIGNTMYMTGKLQGANKSYGITVLLKIKDGVHRIISIRIS